MNDRAFVGASMRRALRDDVTSVAALLTALPLPFDGVPQDVRATKAFQGASPSSATVMALPLSAEPSASS